ncbi:3'-5' exonuclease [Parvicella tangerina]|uniref:3'-5' exonuclease DinG n=1 Tax=Parvicella tangerina TaxID=2829795 RepID=A0A916JNU3_9FLAO|nr:3'-5' exonuclease [Parvicella tangerina]CAG5084605.1 3'-5' exonuclease DinG [Parvicella tangerina]
MRLNLIKPIAVFDIEATGVQIGKDRIVEIAILKVYPDGTREKYETRVNPEMPIPLETSEIHGIYDVDVLNEPKLNEVGKEIIEFIGDADLVGYNCKKFDIPFLIEELDRVGLEFNTEDRKIIDVQNIFHKKEQRTLAAAYQFYCNKELTDAHAAMADVDATFEVLESQLLKYEDLEPTAEFLDEYSVVGPKTLDFARRIGVNKEGEPIFNFGKHKGRKVQDVFRKDPNYYKWIMNGDFAKDTKSKFTKVWNSIK